MINSVIPAILSGNAIILKPAPQTPVPAERLLTTFLAAGLPANVLQVIHLSQETTLQKFVTDPRLEFVAFTGSVVGGRAVQCAAANGPGFKGVGLELGGKDPAYVRADADLAFTAENLVDGELASDQRSFELIGSVQAQCSTLGNHVSCTGRLGAELTFSSRLCRRANLCPLVSLR